MPSLRNAVAWLTPHGIVARRKSRRRHADDASIRSRYAAIAAQPRVQAVAGAVDYNALLAAAVAAGVDEQHLRKASITEPSLDFVVERIGEGPGLHVGNFVGVSLAFLASRTDGLIVAVDPNLPFRGVENPQGVVARLLEVAGVADRVMLVCGYSGSKNPSNQGRVIEGYDPMTEYDEEAAPENVLDNLASFGIQFHWALLDGNHIAEYLRSELESCRRVVAPGGVVFLDDCSDSWPEIRDVFHASNAGWVAEATDGRIGVLRRVADVAGPREA